MRRQIGVWKIGASLDEKVIARETLVKKVGKSTVGKIGAAQLHNLFR